MKIIRDEQSRLRDQKPESGKVSYLRDEGGSLKGTYLENADKSCDGKGRCAGSGDQLLRLLK